LYSSDEYDHPMRNITCCHFLIVEVTEVVSLAGGIIALWKSVVITVKVEIGGAAAQIVLREVADKRRLYLVAITVF
jgi:hypothetical protein